MSGDQLDLDAIEARARDAAAAIYAGDLAMIQRGASQRLARVDVLALAAEVRRLRAELDMSERLLATMDMWADVAETCERKANESHARREEAEAELAALRASIAAQA